jgi:L-alanine-DL-glutamate epimerase-like enolase superfamily enzyme
MQVLMQPFTVHKRFPLTISRGTTAQTTNIWVRIKHNEIEGWGEASPFSTVQEERKNTDELLQEFTSIVPILENYHPFARQEIETALLEKQISSSLRAAIDTALYDWLGKQAGLPLWRLWGLNRDRIVPISVTVGITAPDRARKRVRDWKELMGGAQVLKIKLGAPEGIEADQAMFLAIREEAPDAILTVDANGGWNLDTAVVMCDWLVQHGVKYVEQPLPVGQERNLPQLKSRSPLPIFVDESCFNSRDILKLAHCVDGINLKLMKAGGLTEVMRSIQVAKACGLQIMFGCYSDSILANSAMSHLAPLADYLDLDSHLNLIDDPFVGSVLEEGRLLPNELPGLGVRDRNLAGL